jgi:hypothetical protein
VSRLLLCLFLVGCGGVPAAYVEADRATYTAVGLDWAAYVEGDSSLETDQKDRRLRLLRAWEARILQAEEALAE